MRGSDVGQTGMDTDVVIAGAGPTGLMLACELRLAGVDTRELRGWGRLFADVA